MSSTNQSPHYQKAEHEYLQAQTTEQKIRCLKKMITLAPKHKSAENMRAQLKTRLKKLKYANEKESKKAGSTQKGIKKEDMQAVIIGKVNSGKSSLLSVLTNAEPKISENKFATTKPIIGMINVEDTKIQLIEVPAIESENYNKGIVNTADTILILVSNIEQIEENLAQVKNSPGKKIIIFNKIDLLNKQEQRKLSATLSSKKYNFILISTKTKENLEELKEKIFQSFDKIRVYTKEPGKEKSPRPIIMKPDSTLKDVAEKILKEFSEKVKETRIWGPSSKFPGQKIGLKHKLKDLDVVEFKTK